MDGTNVRVEAESAMMEMNERGLCRKEAKLAEM